MSRVGRIALEQSIAYLTQHRQIAPDAPHGSVLKACEKLADSPDEIAASGAMENA